MMRLWGDGDCEVPWCFDFRKNPEEGCNAETSVVLSHIWIFSLQLSDSITSYQFHVQNLCSLVMLQTCQLSPGIPEKLYYISVLILPSVLGIFLTRATGSNVSGCEKRRVSFRLVNWHVIVFSLQPPVPANYDYVDPSVTKDYDQLNLNEVQLWCHIGQHDRCIKTPINRRHCRSAESSSPPQEKRWRLYILAQYHGNLTQPIK